MKGYEALQEYVAAVSHSFTRLNLESDQKLNLVRFLENVQEKAWVDIKASLFRLATTSYFARNFN
jgi:hypothetical protein